VTFAGKMGTRREDVISFVTICTIDAQEFYFEGIDPPRQTIHPDILPPIFPSNQSQPFSSSAVPSQLPPLDSPTGVSITGVSITRAVVYSYFADRPCSIIGKMQQMLTQQAEELALLCLSIQQHQRITSPPRKKPNQSFRQSSRSTSPAKSDTSRSDGNKAFVTTSSQLKKP
jgi:hypothetical protein